MRSNSRLVFRSALYHLPNWPLTQNRATMAAADTSLMFTGKIEYDPMATGPASFPTGTERPAMTSLYNRMELIPICSALSTRRPS